MIDMANDSSQGDFQFQGSGKLKEGNIIYLQMNRINQAFSKTPDSVTDSALRSFCFRLKQTIQALEDNIDSFLDEDYWSERDEILERYGEASTEDRVDVLHDYFKLIENQLNRQKLWFGSDQYFEVAPIKEIREQQQEEDEGG